MSQCSKFRTDNSRMDGGEVEWAEVGVKRGRHTWRSSAAAVCCRIIAHRSFSSFSFRFSNPARSCKPHRAPVSLTVPRHCNSPASILPALEARGALQRTRKVILGS